MNFKTVYQFITYFSDPAKHFTIAASAGLLLFSLMSIISGGLLEFMVWRGATRTSQIRVAVGMAIISLLAAVSVSLLSHVALDYWYTFFTTPLGPHISF